MTARLGLRWPPKIEDREPGVLYAWYPADRYDCDCGERVWNLDALTVAPVTTEPPKPLGAYRFQHGDNREAVIELDTGWILDPEAEEKLAEWTERVHAYERRVHGRSAS